MRKLVLNKLESKELRENGVVEIERNGFTIFVEKDEYSELGYSITIINDYEKISLAKEETEEEITKEEVKEMCDNLNKSFESLKEIEAPTPKAKEEVKQEVEVKKQKKQKNPIFQKGILKVYVPQWNQHLVVEYMGRDQDFSCVICGEGGSSTYVFNVLHGDTIEEAVQNYENGDYETYGFGREHLPMFCEKMCDR